MPRKVLIGLALLTRISGTISDKMRTITKIGLILASIIVGAFCVKHITSPKVKLIGKRHADVNHGISRHYSHGQGEEGFISEYDIIKGKPQQMIRIHLKYNDERQPILTGLERISKPGLRVYVGSKEIPRVAGGMGVAIISTSKGVMTGQHAWRQGVGGELLCYVM